MNFKEWILPLSLSIIMMYAFQYFFDAREDKAPIASQLKSGAGFIAPSVEDINKPLVLDVAYQKQVTQVNVELHPVTTISGTYIFSNKGAVLQGFSFPWQNGQYSREKHSGPVYRLPAF